MTVLRPWACAGLRRLAAVLLALVEAVHLGALLAPVSVLLVWAARRPARS